MDFSKRWNEHLRRASRKKTDIQCPLCGCGIPTPETAHNGSSSEAAFPVFEKHWQDSHAQVLNEKGTEAEKTAEIRLQWEAALEAKPGNSGPDAIGRLPTAGIGEGVQPSPPRRRNPVGPVSSAAALENRKSKGKSKSPTPSFKRDGSRSRSVSPPKRSKARSPEDTQEFARGSYQKGRLWDPEDDTAVPRPRAFKSKVATYPQRQRPPSGSLSKSHRQMSFASARSPAHLSALPHADNDSTEILKQPETRPISQEQLVAEVKGIYAGLVMVESKCIEVDNNQSSQTDPANKLNNDQWQALIALHRTLLHEHHDFFLASQHPSASPALRRLAAKYAMPARMWRHGIHSFLELLRHRLPASLDHMLTFIYMAYSMMALLYETVPAFEDTWIECLGDLGRYRMAIEDDDIRDREVWTAVSRHWYSLASDKSPTTGRLYHHLAILARPNALQQLYYYSKSLCVDMPFLSTRESILTLFEPIMSRTPNPQQARLGPTELNFVKTHSILFTGKQLEELESTMGTFLKLLDNHIGRSTRRWLESGYHMGISNVCALTGYGDQANPITAALIAFSREHLKPTESQDHPMQEVTSTSEAPSPNATTAGPNSTNQLPNAIRLFTSTYDVVCRRFGDPNILPFLHVTLVFVHHLTFCPDAMAYLATHFPWKLTASMLNTLLNGSSSFENVSPGNGLARLLESDWFPGAVEEGKDVKEGGERAGPRRRPLPDDFAMRGFPWVEKYLPDGWFVTEERIDDDEKYFELASMTEERRGRVVWLGCRIAEREGGKWLRFDKEAKRFGVSPEYEVDLDLEMPGQIPITPGEIVDFEELPDAGVAA
ncbi:hypothetical protein N657DRAFT_655303 [Parathielavia appendiculata]|uniref:DNA/RNA-binding domain-containing protein n=1 Tax=Parathielavia appendiculata TaxID=2587402 RepID=A0AAN6U3E3_9PEZI|nr:hypothetical protein N657DRAFT_655303 [Parathielavia appendiculata]